MRFASIYVDDRPAVALVDESSNEWRLLDGIEEIGPETPLERLLGAASKPGDAVPAEQIVLRPVVPAPRRIVCLGLNYESHVEETHRELPKYPVLFTKWPSCLIAAGADIALPPEAVEPDFEAELAVVIGRAGRRIAKQDALEHVAGVTIANDVTIRDYQYKSHQWLQGKAWDDSTPLGPLLVTLDEVGDVGALDISLKLNGATMQASNTSRLIFDLPTTIATISEFTTLEPGDVILTGTPGGVGYRREPRVVLRPGDRLEVEIERLGRLENGVVAEVVG